MVKHRMQRDRTFGASNLRPIDQREVQIDSGGIHAAQFVLEAELACPGDLSRDGFMEPVEHLLEQLPPP